MEDKRRELKKDLVRKAMINSAETYFNNLYDEQGIHDKNVKVIVKDKDGNEQEMVRTQWDISFLIEDVISSMNDKITLSFNGLNFKKNEIKSVEIIFE